MGKDILESEKSCIIIGAGDLSPIELELKKEDLCIAVDGGYQYCKMFRIMPDLIVGDMDSVNGAIKEEIYEIQKISPEKVIMLDTQKDDTDTLTALKIGLEKGYKMFRLYGAMGGRIEHTIANIQCLQYLKNNNAKAYLIDANVLMTVIQNETISFNPSMKGYLSLFSLEKKAEGVSIKGMKYPLDRAVVTNDYPIGVSNEFIGETGSITVENGVLLLIISSHVLTLEGFF